jgi:hypothetical protein
MSELHDALQNLSPVTWTDLPKDNLDSYLTECFAAGELICNSLPPLADGTPFHASKPHHRKPNQARSHKEIHPSAARPPSAHADHEKLHKSWGKPVKINPSQNPLHVNVYKMAGNDRHGAWFARKSVHEGLGFDKFKRAMMREFSESMTVTGSPGAGAIRGIAADRRLEREDVPGVGKVEVYELSAQFPGPVTPREFLAMLMSSDGALSDKSAVPVEGGEKHLPRHFMVVSRPVDHPDAPLRPGFVRGQYESVELIREIPLSTAKPKFTSDLLLKPNGSTKPGSGDDQANGDALDDPELNPVEWIMITRSDPGGGIPRFLVDRGTPDAMLSDVHKFFNWACALDHIPHPDEDVDQQKEVSRQQESEGAKGNDASLAPFEQDKTTNPKTSEEVLVQRPRSVTEPAPHKDTAPSQPGIISSITNAFEAGVNSYAPTSVSNMVNSHLHPDELSDDSSDTSSTDSFVSAEEMYRVETALEHPPRPSNDTISIHSGDQSEDSQITIGMTRHEKEIQKLVKKRERLDQRLAKKKLAEEGKMRQAQEREQTDAGKVKEKMEKELKKTEEKHRKEVERLEAKKAKETRKAEQKRRKKDEQNKMSLVTRERDEFRSQTDLLRRENSLLREQVLQLQTQNTLITQRLGKISPETARSLQDDLRHKRSLSIKSSRSSDSVPKVGKDRSPPATTPA